MIKNKAINIVLLGAPGAGKGTQAAILSKAFNLLHVSTGDMLREAVKDGTDNGKKIANFMNSGELVPDEIVTQGVIDRMNKPDAESGVILDGYPRNSSQAKSLDEALKNVDRTLDMVLYMKVTEEVVIARLSGRRVCPKCGKIYHVTNMPPAKENICDVCEATLIQRDDDKPDTIKNRLNVYQESTESLIGYYREKNMLTEVDGDLSAEKLFEVITDLFEKEGLVNDNSDE